MEHATRAEILAQAHTLPETLARLERWAWPPFLAERDRVPVFVGCGSSHYLALYAASLARRLSGRPAVAVTGSEAWLAPEAWLEPWHRPFLVAISRSGATTEVLRAVEVARGLGIPALALTTQAGAPLSVRCDAGLELDHVRERSVVMTQSFANLLLALQYMAVHAAASPAARAFAAGLPAVVRAVRELLSRLDGAARQVVGRGWRRYVFLGTGPMYAIAREARLKVQEMSQIEAHAYVTLEFRHGPVSVVDAETCVTIATTPATAPHDAELARELAGLGARVVLAGPVSREAPPGAPDGVDVIELPGGFDDAHYAGLILPLLQLMAYEQTVLLHKNPDAPRHLTHVVELGGGEAGR